MTSLRDKYSERLVSFLEPAAKSIEDFLEDILGDHDAVCSVNARPKAIESFLEKADREYEGEPRYSDPLNQIQDQLGALITTRFLSDVDVVESIVNDSFRHIEQKAIQPDSEYEFGYVGRHFILFIPSDVWSPLTEAPPIRFFELQIKTLFQYAWSETNHNIGYKQMAGLDLQERKLTAYVAAQAWGADRAVDELYNNIYKKSDNEVSNA